MRCDILFNFKIIIIIIMTHIESVHGPPQINKEDSNFMSCWCCPIQFDTN